MAQDPQYRLEDATSEIVDYRIAFAGPELISVRFDLSADTLGAAATVLNLPEGASTTTIESKTNFLAAAPLGSEVVGEVSPIHRGRTTMVWQTKISTGAGRLIAVVTQTQLVLAKRT